MDCGQEQSIEDYQEDIEELKEKWICDFLKDESKVTIKVHFEDKRYFLAEVDFKDQTYIYLYDKKQSSEMLGLKEGNLNLEALWQRHKREANFCLPCELMLNFNKRIITSEGFKPLEVGINFKDTRALITEMRKRAGR